MNAIQSVSNHQNIKQIQADLIPGPPPNYDISLVVNVEPTWTTADIAAGELLCRCRELCYEVLASLDQVTMSQAKLVAVSILDSPTTNPIRVYSTSVESVRIPEIENAVDLQRCSLSEFSMLEDVEVLLKAM